MAALGTKSTKARAPTARWSREEVDQLLDKLQDAKDAGNSSENGFKSAVWTAAGASFSDSLKKNGRVCESKWTRLKKDYKEVKFLVELSGFGWKDDECLVDAEEEVWEELAKVQALPTC